MAEIGNVTAGLLKNATDTSDFVEVRRGHHISNGIEVFVGEASARVIGSKSKEIRGRKSKFGFVWVERDAVSGARL